MSKGNKPSKKTGLKIFTLQILWIGYFILLIVSGVLNLVLHYDLKRLVVNVFILTIGVTSLLAEFYCFKFYSYMLFIYTPLGRGIFMAVSSCLLLDDNLIALVTSLVLFLSSLIYLVISVLFGGINKPLFNSSLKHRLDLTAQVYFINNKVNRHGSENGVKLAREHRDTSRHPDEFDQVQTHAQTALRSPLPSC